MHPQRQDWDVLIVLHDVWAAELLIMHYQLIAGEGYGLQLVALCAYQWVLFTVAGSLG